MADSTPQSYHTDPQLYLYTSLTSGSSHIVTATSRLQTILKANRIDFKALDVATDEKARMLWGRRAGKRKLPGLVRYGMIIGDLEQIEDWNEYGELKQNLSESKPSAAPATPSTSAATTPSKPPAIPTAPKLPERVDNSNDAVKPTDTAPTDAGPSAAKDPPKPDPVSSLSNAMRQVGFEAAKQAGEKKQKARDEFLAAAKAENPELKKLDNSTAGGLPPPTGETEAQEAQKPESVASPEDKEPESTTAGSTDDERTMEARKNAEANMGSSPPPKDFLSKKKEQEAEEAHTDIPSSVEVSHKANEAIAEDEANKLEGKDLASAAIKDETIDVKVPTAKEVEEQANQAIVDDESSHVRFQGRGSVPHALSPEPPKAQPKQPDDLEDLDAVKEAESKLGGVDHNTETDDISATATGQEQKVGVQPSADAEAKDNADQEPSDSKEELEKASSDQQQKLGVSPSVATGQDPPSDETQQAEDEQLTKTASRQEQKVGVNPTIAAEEGRAVEEVNSTQNEDVTETASRQEQKVGVDSPDTEGGHQQDQNNAGTDDSLSKTATRQEQKVGATSMVTEPKDPSPENKEAQSTTGEEEPLAEHAASAKTAAAAGGDQEALPGIKTQDQPAAAADKAGDSVQD